MDKTTENQIEAGIDSSKTPVLESGRTGGRIVVGVDGSEASLRALRRAVRIAGALDQTVEAVTSWRFPADYATFGDAASMYLPEQDARDIAQDAARRIWGEHAPDWFSFVAQEGAAAEVLIERSQGAEMLIVGSRGHGGLVGVLLGSVSAACAERASCPVLIMH